MRVDVVVHKIPAPAGDGATSISSLRIALNSAGDAAPSASPALFPQPAAVVAPSGRPGADTAAAWGEDKCAGGGTEVTVAWETLSGDHL
jgi:hypothetical protein